MRRGEGGGGGVAAGAAEGRAVARLAAEARGAGDERLRSVLHDYFAWATTTTMSRYHDSADDVPHGLHIPKWSWNGLLQ